MQAQIYCPCCNEKAISLWRKLTLSRYSTHICKSCGTLLGLEHTGTAWFFLGWIPLSLSGYFSLPLKLALGSLGIGLILFPFAFLIPLVEKTGETSKRYPKWVIGWLTIFALGMIASDRVNLLASSETKIFALCISIVLTPLVMQEFWQRVPKADEKILAFMVMSVLVACMHYFTLSSFPPALLTLVSANEGRVDAIVIHKRHTSKLTRCANSIEIAFVPEDKQKHEICISEESWQQIKKGDVVLLRIRENHYGRLVTAVEARDQRGLTNI